jgi:hypothetical protein
MSNLIERHRRACDGFARRRRRALREVGSPDTVHRLGRPRLSSMSSASTTSCYAPRRPRRPAATTRPRWAATAAALFTVLAEPGVLDRSTELPGGGQSTPGKMLGALTTDVLVHVGSRAP